MLEYFNEEEKMLEDKEIEDQLSFLIGCSRAKIIMDVIRNGGIISEVEKALLQGHCTSCEKCQNEYEIICKK
jgi:hypothetical protein